MTGQFHFDHMPEIVPDMKTETNYVPKILAVDDEPVNLMLLEAVFSSEGYETIMANDGPEALEVVKDKDVDIILLDLLMPVMHGFEVLERLKQDETTRHIPVIIVSAMADKESYIKGINLGALDHFCKAL